MSRESDRRAWRERVARAAEAWRVAEKHTHYGATIVRHLDDAAGRGVELTWKHRADLDLAISAPKPWARPRAGADLGKWARHFDPANVMSRAIVAVPGGVHGRCTLRSLSSFYRARLRRKRRAAQRRRR